MNKEKNNLNPFNRPWRTANFNSKEFDCPKLKGSGNYMDIDFIEILQAIRTKCDFPFKINSGIRTVEHNAIVKGKSNSAHLYGLAADIHCDNPKERFLIVKYAIELGVYRIGLYDGFIHLDISSRLPNPVIFLG